MRENRPLLSRVVDPPGTKGGPWAGNFPGPPKIIFSPGWSHHPGQKALLSRVMAPPGTKGIFGRAGQIPSPRPTFSPRWIYHPDKRGPFSLIPAKSFVYFLFLLLFFKIGFHLLIQLKKLWFQKLWKKIAYLYIDLIHATKMFNFHSSDWINKISKFFEIIFFMLTMQKYIRWINFLKLLLFDRKWVLSRY